MRHHPLLLLSILRLKGQWRKQWRSISSPAGMLTALLTVGFFAMVLLPRLLTPGVPRDALDPVASIVLHPALLLVMWLSSVIGSRLKSPIAFTMAEVDFLFCGPFSRRQLLVHKLLISMLGPLGLAIMAALAFPLTWWPAALVGVLLAATFMVWFTILLGLAAAWIGTRYRVLLWTLVAVALVAAAGSVWQSGALSEELGYQERLAALESSWAARIVLAPFTVLSRAIGAHELATLAVWGSAAALLVAAVGGAILQLDGYFVEASLQASRRHYAMLERLKRSGGSSAFPVRGRRRFSLPRPPRLWGAGPVAWRQAIDVVRSSGGPLMVVAIPAGIGLAIALAVVVLGSRQVPAVAIMIPVTLLLGFALNVIPMGLRADLEHLETLKTLPLEAYPIVLGSVTFAILYESFLQLVAVLAMAVVLGEWFPAVPLTLAIALPINVLTLSLDSVLVLLFPSVRKFNPGDPLVGVRIMLTSMAKVIFAGAALLVALAPVGIAWLVGISWLAIPIAAGYAILLAEGLATIWLAAVLFERFDASTQMADDE